MASRLSSLLVRDGLVSVKRMERAFQRQVIQGGNLDTILIEMKLLPEDRLLQYLSLATGLPPADDSESDSFDRRAQDRCPADMADRFKVLPLSFEQDALRLLVCDPVNLGELETLANELNLPIQPLVVPEYRFALAKARLYGQPEEPRFAKVAELARESRTGVPVGRGASVIVETSTGRRAPAAPTVTAPEPEPAAQVAVDPPAAGRSTQRFSTDAFREHMAETERAAESTFQQIRERRDSSRPAPPPEAVPSEIHDRTERRAVQMDSVPPPAAAAPAPAPAIEGDLSALPPSQARDALSAAEHRDEIFTLLLRAMLHRTSYAALLTIQGGAAIGRLAITGGALDPAVKDVLIPLDVETPFKQVVTTSSPYIGAIKTGDKDVDGMIARMGGSVPSSAVLLPIALPGRVVALALAHRGNKIIKVADISELLPLAAVAGGAVSRLLMRAKARSTQKKPSSTKQGGDAEDE